MINDLTKGSPLKLIIFFTIPLLIGNIFQQFYNIADTIIVGRTINVNALAAVGATGTLNYLAVGFIIGFTTGFSVITAQRFGAGDYTGMRKSFAMAILQSAALCTVLTTVCILIARPLLQLLQTPENIIADSYTYIIIIYAGLFATTLFNLLSNMIRALGDSRTPLFFLVIACVINIVLDFVLILNFGMGVAGAAVATVIAQLISGLLCLVYMLKKFPMLSPHKADFFPDWKIIRASLLVGLPMAFQTSIISLSSMIVQFSVNQLGSVAVAAFTAAQKIDQICIQPLMSFGITMATYVAQNYGAGNIVRIRKGVNQCALISVVWSLCGGIMLLLFGRLIAAAVVGGDQTEVIGNAYTYLTINGLSESLLALLFVYRYALQGLGKSISPMVSGIVELFLRAGVVILFAKQFGFTGICFAGPAAWLGAMLVLGGSYFYHIRRLTRAVPAL